MNQRDKSAWRTRFRLTTQAAAALDGSGHLSHRVDWLLYEELVAARCVTRKSGRVTPFGQRVGQAARGELGAPPSWEDIRS